MSHFAALKHAIDQVYGTFLAKGSHPFVYMDLQIDAKNVDVNMHPTKHEVNFLHENEIVDRIRAAFEDKLVGSNETRELYTQQLLPGASNPTLDANESQVAKGKETKVYAKDIIRSDSKEQKLEKFFGASVSKDSFSETQKINISNNNMSIELQSDNENSESPRISTGILPMPVRTNNEFEQKFVLIHITIINSLFSFVFFFVSQNSHRPTKLTSILKLRNRIEHKCDGKLRQILSDSIFIGCINRRQLLIQSASNMYICDVQKMR